MSNQLLIAGVDRFSQMRAGSLRVTKRLDQRNTASLVLETTSAFFLPSEGTELIVNFDDDSQFGGTIRSVELERPAVGTSDDTLIRANITSDGYNRTPYRRTINGLYEAPTYSTAGSIISELVGSILDEEGISIGNIEDGCPIELYSIACKSVGDVLDDLAAKSGYKWYINNSKDLYFIEEDTLINESHKIDTEDTAEGSFHDFQITAASSDLSEYANKIFARGGLGDGGYAVVVSVHDAAEIAARTAIEGGSGVYGYILDAGDETDSDILTTMATAELKKRSRIPRTISFRTRQSFVPQFILQVRLPYLGISTLTPFLIEQVDISHDSIGLLYEVTAVYRNPDTLTSHRIGGAKEFFDAFYGNNNSQSLSLQPGGYVKNIVQCFTATDFPTGAKPLDWLADIDNPTMDDGLDGGTVLTWASPRQINAISAVTLPDPASSKNIQGAAADHTGVVMFCVRNANELNGMVSVGFGAFSTTLFPQQSVVVRCGNTNKWEVV